MEIKDLKVGQELIQQDSNSNYTLVKITKLTPASIFIGTKQFRKPKYYDNFSSVGDSYRTKMYLYEVTENSLEQVAKTTLRLKEKDEKQAAEKLERETKEAEHLAFLETEEGKKWFATETFWDNTEIDVTYTEWNDNRQATIILKGNGKNFSNSEVVVRQYSDYNWKENFEYYKPCEIQSYNARFDNGKQAKRFADVILKASEIAELWDEQRAGKKVGEDSPT